MRQVLSSKEMITQGSMAEKVPDLALEKEARYARVDRSMIMVRRIP